ncbi:MAG: hypothetical protein ACJAYU_003541 [Bradymonadia bacterium]|jgi:hypothetical protein
MIADPAPARRRVRLPLAGFGQRRRATA